MRVVSDSARAAGTRRTDPPGTGIASGADTGAVGAAGGPNPAAAASGNALPLLPAGIFLLACLIGGVVVAMLRPF